MRPAEVAFLFGERAFGVQRAALIIRMNDLLIDDVVVIPVVWRNGVRAMSHKLQGVELSDWDSDFWGLASWYREA
jgi:peptide/nickel transport system substrate-binding protein